MSEVAIEVKEKGGEDLLDFKTKWLNIWVSYRGGSYLDAECLNDCASDLTISDMEGKECFLGIDLSSGGDLTSIALIFPLEDGTIFIHSHSFMPELRLLEHENSDDAPYRIWVEDELLTLTTGAFGIKTDYKFIINYLKDLLEKYQITVKSCGYDNHNASAFIADLDFLGCDLIDIPQSAKALNDATVDFRLSIKSKQVKYDKNNKLLKWSAINATTTKNSFGEIKVDKNLQENRIDPIDAILDAWKLYFETKESSNIAFVPK
ncbi:phage Terminase family protein [[Clostridium] sordellii ATCC 9714]|nr:phage Terminase family protein [[Clostridium] sordellii ATCC 9714] [Paeniclostridium sordellii ATCC 9714]